MPRQTMSLLAACALCASVSWGYADVVISTAATQNMSCSGGVCAPTAKKAVLNVGDLETLLASGNVKITTTGAGVEANNIESRARFSWTSSNVLTLDAYHSIVVYGSISVTGFGGFSVLTNDGGSNGSLSFLGNGNMTFSNLSSTLTINRTAYRLENSLPKLARLMNTHPNDAFALAANYDASRDGIYGSSPILVPFGGAFNGLGHVISHLVVEDEAGSYVGFFASLNYNATVSDFHLHNLLIIGTYQQSVVGGIAGLDNGTISDTSVDGGVVEGEWEVGGLTGYLNTGRTISNCSSDVSVQGAYAGGLVGTNVGSIETSFANGRTRGSIFQGNNVGGLVGSNSGNSITNVGSIVNSYATGIAADAQAVGGLVGSNSQYASVETSYSTGRVRKSRDTGGFIGDNQGKATSSYWDTSTSKTKQGVGAGNNTGITGLTTQQLRSGLPPGFDPRVWRENPNINQGLPYLIDNPPHQ